MTNLNCLYWLKPRHSWFSGWLFSIFGNTNRGTLPGDHNEDLLVSLAVKDPQAFEDLYRKYVDRVYVYHLARTTSREEAEDLTSQTFLAALEGISGYRKQGSFAAWIFSIARRKLVDHYRRPKNVPLEFAEPTESNLDDEIDLRLSLQQINHAFLNIAPDRVEALCLRIFGQLSTAETGQILSKSEGAVRNLVYRALQDIRENIPVFVEMEDE
jgi:RNA polymerase sigma-70 factor (ECF subfamily)